MAMLRNLAIAIIKLDEATSVAATTRTTPERHRAPGHPRAHRGMTKTDTTPLPRPWVHFPASPASGPTEFAISGNGT
jgi:hypothetical protein